MQPRDELAERLTPENLLRSLRSQTCPSCGLIKPPRKSICTACWAQLTPTLRAHLYRLIGQGYDKAMLAALQHLGKSQLILPGDPIKEQPK